MQSPFEEHTEAVYRILKYLKGNPGRGLFFWRCEERGFRHSPMQESNGEAINENLP